MKKLFKFGSYLDKLFLRLVFDGVVPDTRFRNRPRLQHERDAQGRAWFTPPGSKVRMQVYDMREAFEQAWRSDWAVPQVLER